MRSVFPTTRWSALLGARSKDEPERRRSWGALVAAYWKPAYKHVRLRWRAEPADAEDVVQAFFARAMENDFFDSYEPERARFRTFFRTCLDRFASNEHKARSREKRGGGATRLSLDFEGAERELARVAAAPSPEEVFDKEWRRSVLALAIDALRVECAKAGKERALAAFERYDLAEPDARPSYDDVATALGVPATTVTNDLAWARRELRRLALSTLGELTATDAELRDESALLFAGRAP